MKTQVYECSILKPFKEIYIQTQRQLSDMQEMAYFSNRKISEAELKTGQFQEGAFYVTNNGGISENVRILPYFGDRKNLHAFKHPLVLDHTLGYTNVVFNATPYGQLGSDGVVKIRQSSLAAFVFQIQISSVLGKAVSGDLNQRGLSKLGNLPAAMAGLCISMAFAKRFGVDYNTQMRIQICATYYYCACSLGIRREDAVELCRIITKAPSELVNEIVSHETVELMQDLPGLVKAISQTANNARLEDLSLSTLYVLLGQYWITENGTELIGCALELPQLWAFLCYSSSEHLQYRKNALSDILKIASKHHDAKQLLHGMRDSLVLA